MIPTPITDALLRRTLEWGRGGYADARIIEDLTDHARNLERDMVVLHHQAKAADANRERVLEILSHIYAHQWPEDMKLEDGRIMQFAPNLETTQMFLRGLWKAIKEIPEAIDKAKNDAKT